MATRSERRLVAILAADVAGYSRHVDRDEEGTVDVLKERLIEFDAIVRREGGEIVNTAGDGVLAQFPSAVRATEAAIAIQQRMAELNRDPSRRLRFRIGINVGDVLSHGRDILGAGVNVAARLEQIADPGAVLVAGSAFDQLQGRLSLPLDFAGEQRVKNISRPIRTYRVRLDGSRGIWRPQARSRRAALARGAAIAAAFPAAGAVASYRIRTDRPQRVRWS